MTPNGVTFLFLGVTVQAPSAFLCYGACVLVKPVLLSNDKQADNGPLSE